MVVFLQVLTPLSPDDVLDLDGEAGDSESTFQVGLDQVGDCIAERLVDSGGLRSVDRPSRRLVNTMR